MAHFANEALLSPAELREIVYIDPMGATLRWKNSGATGTMVKDAPAGHLQVCGYMRIKIASRTYAAHRVVWCLMHGRWPTATIDHVNGIKSDNRIENLREATLSQNGANRRRSLGRDYPYPRGVHFMKRANKFRASISVAGQSKHLGSFATVEEARQAYLAAAQVAFGPFARLD